MPDYAYFATGRDFPDALSGGGIAAKTNSPLLLVNYNVLSPATTDFLMSNGANVVRYYLLGGTGVITSSVGEILGDI